MTWTARYWLSEIWGKWCIEVRNEKGERVWFDHTGHPATFDSREEAEAAVLKRYEGTKKGERAMAREEQIKEAAEWVEVGS